MDAMEGRVIMANPYPYPPIPSDCIDSPKPPVGSIHLPQELTLVPSQPSLLLPYAQGDAEPIVRQ